MTFSDGKKMSPDMATENITKVSRYKWSDPTKPGTLSFIDKGLIHVDHRYQREAIESKVTRLASKFTWPAFGVLIVARRGEKLYAVTGQHRLLAVMKRADVKKVPCIVFDSEGVVGEAEAFLAEADERKPLTAVEKFKAKLVTRDEVAIKVNALVDASGRVVASYSGPNSVRCIEILQRAVVTMPKELDSVWPVVVSVCRGSHLDKRLLAACLYIEKHLPDGVSLSEKKWSDKLKQAGPENIARRIGAFAFAQSSGTARIWAEGVMAVLNKGLRETARLQLRGRQDQPTTE